MATSITVSTDGTAPNSGDAVKTFVDANIQITPNGDEPVGHDAHVHGARERQRRHGPVRERAERDADHASRSTAAPGAFTTTQSVHDRRAGRAPARVNLDLGHARA